MFSLQKTVLGKRWFDRRIYLLISAVVGLLVFDLVAVERSWYWTHRWLDIPVHAVGGLILSLLLYYLVFLNYRTSSMFTLDHFDKTAVFSTMVFWTLVVAVGWEIVEFIGGRTYLSPQYAADLFVDISVTCIGALVGYGFVIRMKNTTR